MPKLKLRCTVLPFKAEANKLYFSAFLSPVLVREVENEGVLELEAGAGPAGLLFKWAERFPFSLGCASAVAGEGWPEKVKLTLANADGTTIDVKNLDDSWWKAHAKQKPDAKTVCDIWNKLLGDKPIAVPASGDNALSETREKRPEKIEAGHEIRHAVAKSERAGFSTLEGLSSQKMQDQVCKFLANRDKRQPDAEAVTPEEKELRQKEQQELRATRYALDRHLRLGSSGKSNLERKEDDKRQAGAGEAKDRANSREFHEIVSGLGDYPAMLRALGLVFEFWVPMTTPGAEGKSLLDAEGPTAFKATLTIPNFESLPNQFTLCQRPEKNGVFLLAQTAGENSPLTSDGRFLKADHLGTTQVELMAGLRAAFEDMEARRNQSNADRARLEEIRLQVQALRVGAVEATDVKDALKSLEREQKRVEAQLGKLPPFAGLNSHSISVFFKAGTEMLGASFSPRSVTETASWFQSDLIRGYQVQVAARAGTADSTKPHAGWKPLGQRVVQFAPGFTAVDDACVSVAAMEGTQPLSGWLLGPLPRREWASDASLEEKDWATELILTAPKQHDVPIGPPSPDTSEEALYREALSFLGKSAESNPPARISIRCYLLATRVGQIVLMDIAEREQFDVWAKDIVASRENDVKPPPPRGPITIALQQELRWGRKVFGQHVDLTGVPSKDQSFFWVRTYQATATRELSGIAGVLVKATKVNDRVVLKVSRWAAQRQFDRTTLNRSGEAFIHDLSDTPHLKEDLFTGNDAVFKVDGNTFFAGMGQLEFALNENGHIRLPNSVAVPKNGKASKGNARLEEVSNGHVRLEFVRLLPEGTLEFRLAAPDAAGQPEEWLPVRLRPDADTKISTLTKIEAGVNDLVAGAIFKAELSRAGEDPQKSPRPIRLKSLREVVSRDFVFSRHSGVGSVVVRNSNGQEVTLKVHPADTRVLSQVMLPELSPAKKDDAQTPAEVTDNGSKITVVEESEVAGGRVQTVLHGPWVENGMRFADGDPLSVELQQDEKNGELLVREITLLPPRTSRCYLGWFTEVPEWAGGELQAPFNTAVKNFAEPPPAKPIIAESTVIITPAGHKVPWRLRHGPPVNELVKLIFHSATNRVSKIEILGAIQGEIREYRPGSGGGKSSIDLAIPGIEKPHSFSLPESIDAVVKDWNLVGRAARILPEQSNAGNVQTLFLNTIGEVDENKTKLLCDLPRKSPAPLAVQVSPETRPLVKAEWELEIHAGDDFSKGFPCIQVRIVRNSVRVQVVSLDKDSSKADVKVIQVAEGATDATPGEFRKLFLENEEIVTEWKPILESLQVSGIPLDLEVVDALVVSDSTKHEGQLMNFPEPDKDDPLQAVHAALPNVVTIWCKTRKPKVRDIFSLENTDLSVSCRVVSFRDKMELLPAIGKWPKLDITGKEVKSTFPKNEEFLPDQIVVEDTLLHWFGGSIARRDPGKGALGNNVDRQPKADAGSADSWKVQVPWASLPPLRFGWEYRFRFIPVDLAGNPAHTLSNDTPKNQPWKDQDGTKLSEEVLVFKPFGDFPIVDRDGKPLKAPPVHFQRFDVLAAPRLSWKDQVSQKEFIDRGSIRDLKLRNYVRPVPGEREGAQIFPAVALHKPSAGFQLARASGTIDGFMQVAGRPQPPPLLPPGPGPKPKPLPALPPTDISGRAKRVFAFLKKMEEDAAAAAKEPDPKDKELSEIPARSLVVAELPDIFALQLFVHTRNILDADWKDALRLKQLPNSLDVTKWDLDPKNCLPDADRALLVLQARENDGQDTIVSLEDSVNPDTYGCLIARDEILELKFQWWPKITLENDRLKINAIANLRGLFGTQKVAPRDISMPLVIQVRHITNFPAAPPEKLGLRLGERFLGDTGATFDGLYRIDRPSTARLMIQAATEVTYDDQPESPLPRVPWRELKRILPQRFQPDPKTAPEAYPTYGHTSEGRDKKSGILNIFPTDFAVSQLAPTNAGQFAYEGGNTVTLRYRHEIGDMKHRTVCYRALALSRWESDFPGGHAFPNPEPVLYSQPPISHPDEHVPWHSVEIPATTRPKRPDIVDREVLYEWLPAQPDGEIWQKSRTANRWSFERMRRPGFRLWIGRPWYDSGSEEKLAILCWKSARVPKKQVDHYLKLVSRWGTDPVVETEVGAKAPLGLLTREDFLETDGDSRTDLASPQPPDKEPETQTAGTAQISSGDLPLKIGIATYRPMFHPEERLWFVDVFPRAPRYTPFLFLSVARYQPFSLRECALSEPVRLEPLQLHPPRTLRVDVEESSALLVKVRLSGIFPDEKVEELRRLVVCRLEKWAGGSEPGRASTLGWVHHPLPDEATEQMEPKLRQLLTEQPGISMERKPIGKAVRYELDLELPVRCSEWKEKNWWRLTVVELEVYPTVSDRIEGRIWTGRTVYADNVNLHLAK